jgi:DNA/RNA-binding domain of Phe-tRNA-synthetase-like protein
MKFKIKEEIFEKFPGLNIGVLVVKGINNQGKNEEVLQLIQKKESEIKANFKKEELTSEAKIKVWREAYSSFGAKPKKYKCSVENLYRMILDGIELKPINQIVDIYNYISINNIVPVGGDDIDKIDGDIVLQLADGTEDFTQLNSSEIKHPKAGEVIYRDDKEVLCRRWNWRECDKSKMTPETKNVTLVVECLPPFTKGDLNNILEEFKTLVEKYCSGQIKSLILNEDNKEVEI